MSEPAEHDPDRVRRLIDAWNRRDHHALLSQAAPDIEYVNSPLAVETGTRRGRAEYEGVLRAQWEILGDARLEILELEEIGADVFVAAQLERTMPGGGEGRMQTRIGMRFSFRDGLVVRQEMIPHEELSAARAAAAARGPARG